MSIDFTNATLAALKSFLVANAADAGLASAMKFKSWKIADVRTYAEQVQALRDAGYVGDIAPYTVEAAIQQVANERAADEAAAAVAEATAAELMAMVNEQVEAASAAPKAKRAAPTVATDKFVVQMKATLEQATVEGDVLVVGADALLACGWSRAYTTLRNGWSKTKSGGLAAASLGYAVKTRTDATQPGGFVVVLSRAA